MATNANVNINVNTGSATTSIGQLNTAINTTTTTITDLRTQAEALETALQGESIGSQRFQELSAQLRGVNTQLADVDATLSVMSTEDLAGGIQAATGGLMDLVGGMTLLGASNESVERIAQTFAQVEGVTRGVTGAMELYTQGTRVMTSIITRATTAQAAMATAQTAQGNASIFATIKMRALNLVMNANPVLLLVTAVATLGAAMYALSDDTDTAKESQEELTKAFADSAKNVADVKQKVNEVGVAFNAAKKGITSKKEALKIYNETLGASLGYAKNYNEAERLYNSKTDAYIKATTLRSQAQALATLSAQKYAEAFENSQKVELTNLQVLELAKTQVLKGEKAALAQGKEFVRQNRKEANEQLTKDIEALNKESNRLLTQALEVESRAGITSVEIEETKQEERKQVVKKSNDDIFKNQQEFYRRYTANIFKYTNEEEKAIEKVSTVKAEKLSSDIDAADAALLKREENIKAISELEYQLNNDLIGLNNQKLKDLEAQKDKELLLAGESVTERERIEKEYALKVQELEKETADLRKQNAIDFVDTIQSYVQVISDVVSQFTDVLTEINSRANDSIADNIQKQYDESTKSLDAQLANRLISEEEYNIKKDRLDREKAKKERDLAQKAFEQQKKIQIANATAQGIQAVLAGYSSGLAYPLIGPATGAIFAGIAGAFAATQIALIASQKFKAAKGGIVPGTGFSNVDSVDALLAPGESVINAKSTAMYAPILSEINQAGGGTALVPTVSSTDGMATSTNSGSNNNTNTTVRAYVVEQDITKSQKNIRRYEKNKNFF